MDDDLITAVCRREPLWNPTHKLHRNVNVLKSLWAEVADETSRDIKTIKTRWKNLRAYYVKECQKLYKSKDRYISPWQYFEPLKFLGTTFATPERLVPDYNTDDSTSTCNIEEAYDAFQEHGFPLIEIDSEPHHFTSETPPRKKFRGEKQITEKEDVLIELDRNKIEMLDQEENSRSNDDLLFFESLLPYMKNIPLVRKLRLRSKIQDIISKELESAQCDND